MTSDKDEQLTKEETARRLERALRRSLVMPPKPHPSPKPATKKGATRKSRAPKPKSAS